MKFWRVPSVLLLLVSLLAGCSKPSGVDGPKVAPAWRLKNLEGKEVALADFKGKVVLLDFWATWCAPCRTELPEYVKLQEKYRDRGLVVVGLSLDSQGPEPVKKFAESLGINYLIVMGDQDVTDDYKVEVVPTTFLVDREGRVRHEKTGAIKSVEEYEKVIVSLL